MEEERGEEEKRKTKIVQNILRTQVSLLVDFCKKAARLGSNIERERDCLLIRDMNKTEKQSYPTYLLSQLCKKHLNST